MLFKVLALGLWATIGSSFANEAPQPAPSVEAPLTGPEKNRIRASFMAAQASEERALLHRQEIDRKEQGQLEEKQRRDFIAQQQGELAKYFASTHDPRARREFQQGQERARKEWDIAAQARLETRSADWGRQLNEVRSRQQEHRRLLEQALAAGRKPEPHLWPPRGL